MGAEDTVGSRPHCPRLRTSGGYPDEDRATLDMSSLSTAGIDVGHEIARGPSPWVELPRLVVVRREHEPDVRARLRSWADETSRAAGARVVKQSRVRTVLRMPANPPLPSLYVKIHRVLGAWNSLRSAIRS